MVVISQASVEHGPQYNEAEVRFHIIDPILRALGYPDAEGVYLNLEEKLEYPYFHIGRRSKKDQPVGYPDYRAGLMGARGSFTVEAKAGSIEIADKEIEQAHSYAAHAQVGANYFVLANGMSVAVYETLSGAHPTPIVQLPLSEINDRFHQLENVLSPSSLARNCRTQYDSKLKLCHGLASSVQLRTGEYRWVTQEYQIFIGGSDVTAATFMAPIIADLDRKLAELQAGFILRMDRGLVERGDDGRIVASAHFPGVTRNNEAMMQLMGLDQISVVTRDRFLSSDPSNPTIFEATHNFTVPEGAPIGQLFGEMAPAQVAVSGETFFRAALAASSEGVGGQYLALSKFHASLPGDIPLEIKFNLVGSLEMSF